MDKLRWPAFLVACLAALMVVGLETGAHWLAKAKTPSSLGTASGGGDGDKNVSEEIKASGVNPADLAARAAGERPPGIAIPDLAILDGLLLFTVAMMAAPLIWSDRIHGKLQGIVSLIFSILILLAAIKLLFIGFEELMLMVSLVLAVPFGPIAYLVKWGYFDVGGATTILSALLALKILFVLALVAAHQRFLQNKGLLLLVGCSFLAHLVITILHAIAPMPFVSITDALGGVIVLVIALIWAIFFLIWSIPAVIKAIV